MPVLNSKQRSQLEKAVIKARRLSVRGAYNTLKAFAVDNNEPYAHMSADERALRNQLRSKARLLGDSTTAIGGHTIDKLAYELAYEYWHQMLFAKFLEANSLLMHPEHEIAVSMEECEELGQEEGFDDKWQAAASYASKMLPAIFRQDDPLMQLKYATEDRLALEELIEDIAEDVFQADDSLGWVYQYWQTEEKERINAEGNKIDGDSISAVTQLFTEPYMVHFLIDNTLGAWWTARNPGVTSPYEFKYLRTLDDGTPAAGSFDGWPETIAEITMLDPCMGSGHFVVDVFMAMAALRMHDEKLSKAEACDAVIRDNVHGLELDARCTQIAAFNLALTAWKFCGAYRILPEMNLACCGIAPTGKKEDWVKLANSELNTEKRTRLKGGLERMYDLFQQAPELGSLIDPTTIEKDAFTSDFEELQPFLEDALSTENGDELNERSVIAAGVAKAGKLLVGQFNWIISNYPFLGIRRQQKVLLDFCKDFFPRSRHELATVFAEKLINQLAQGGCMSFISPQVWMFIASYEEFREYLINNVQINFTVKLGTNAFSAISGEVVNVGLFNLIKEVPDSNSEVFALDASKPKTISSKIEELMVEKTNSINQLNLLNYPDSRILLGFDTSLKLLSKFTDSLAGIQNGDSPHFLLFFWELGDVKSKYWTFLQSAVKTTTYYGGCEYIIYYDSENGHLRASKEYRRHNLHDSDQRGKEAWGKPGVLVSRMSDLATTMYLGYPYDQNAAVMLPYTNEEDKLSAIYSFVSSEEFNSTVREIDPKLNVTNSTLIKVPFDLERWQKVADEKYPNGLPKPYSGDPTQWLFHGHPLHTESPLQVAIARLMGYEWPAENDTEMELSDEAKEKIKAIKELELPFDEDGIVCIPSVNGEASASDRIRENIMTIWAEEYDGSTLSNLIEQEGSKKRDIESYLRDDYFTHHFKLFKNRPFIWHIWDGRKDGFAALVNYHKLDKATLEKLIYTYLGDWINQCDLKRKNNVSGADGLYDAALKLKEKLVLILKGEPPYDLFIRWKSLEEQAIGWDPDINDGVRMNVYPFLEAGVLRKKFNVKWGKDRGKNPSGSLWGPERWNRYEDLDDVWKLKDENKNIIPSLSNEGKRKAKKQNIEVQ
jgi:hypothetical protein